MQSDLIYGVSSGRGWFNSFKVNLFKGITFDLMK